mgnify:CR=1 FL=1
MENIDKIRLQFEKETGLKATYQIHTDSCTFTQDEIYSDEFLEWVANKLVEMTNKLKREGKYPFRR